MPELQPQETGGGMYQIIAPLRGFVERSGGHHPLVYRAWAAENGVTRAENWGQACAGG